MSVPTSFKIRRRFKNVKGDKVLNEIKHCFEVLKKHPEAKIYVGTDSQSHRRMTKFATVIAFRHGNKGAHFIYVCDTVYPKIRDINTRLVQEVYRTMDIVTYLLESEVPVHAVDFDFNEDKARKSNKLVSFATGWAKGMGLKASVKPNEMVAAKAADHLVR